MADANTSLFGFVKPEVGASADSWGGKLNNDYDDIDGLLGAYTLTGSSNAYVLTTGMSLAAYASGQRFCVKWNHTNSGSATLNVDGLGATTIKKRDASTNCSASDLVSGSFAFVAYDGTNFVLLSPVASDFQALDATLTALAALSWSSGNALVQFTAADTVSLTLTPSVSSVTASQGAANTTPSGTFVNTTDNASVCALRIEGDRATPANNDLVFASFYLSSGAGTQRESGRITSQLWDVTNGAEYGAMLFGLISAGSFVNMLYLNPFEFSPNSSDGVPLGSASRSWSDLFLASGAVLNFNNGDVVMTHSSNALEVTGGGFAGPLLQVSSVGGETLTAAAHRNRQLLLDGNITLDDGVFAGGDWGVLTADGTNRTITRASGLTMYVNGVDSASATVPARTTAGFIYETASVCHIIGSAY